MAPGTEGIHQEAERWGLERSPYLGMVVPLIDAIKSHQSGKAFHAGTATEEDYNTLAANIVRAEHEQGKSWGEKTFDLGTRLPAFLLEWNMLSGPGEAARTAASKAAANYTEGAFKTGAQKLLAQSALEEGAQIPKAMELTLGEKAATKVTGALAEGLTRTALRPDTLVAQTLQNAAPTPVPDGKGGYEVQPGMPLGQAAYKSFRQSAIENIVFSAGGFGEEKAGNSWLAKYGKGLASGTLSAEGTKQLQFWGQAAPEASSIHKFAFAKNDDERQAALLEFLSQVAAFGGVEAVEAARGHAQELVKSQKKKGLKPDPNDIYRQIAESQAPNWSRQDAAREQAQTKEVPPATPPEAAKTAEVAPKPKEAPAVPVAEQPPEQGNHVDTRHVAIPEPEQKPPTVPENIVVPPPPDVRPGAGVKEVTAEQEAADRAARELNNAREAEKNRLFGLGHEPASLQGKSLEELKAMGAVDKPKAPTTPREAADALQKQHDEIAARLTRNKIALSRARSESTRGMDRAEEIDQHLERVKEDRTLLGGKDKSGRLWDEGRAPGKGSLKDQLEQARVAAADWEAKQEAAKKAAADHPLVQKGIFGTNKEATDFEKEAQPIVDALKGRSAANSKRLRDLLKTYESDNPAEQEVLKQHVQGMKPSVEPVERGDFDSRETAFDKAGLTERQKYVLHEVSRGRDMEDIAHDEQMRKKDGTAMTRAGVEDHLDKALAKMPADFSIDKEKDAELADRILDRIEQGVVVARGEISSDPAAEDARVKKRISQLDKIDARMTELMDRLVDLGSKGKLTPKLEEEIKREFDALNQARTGTPARPASEAKQLPEDTPSESKPRKSRGKKAQPTGESAPGRSGEPSPAKPGKVEGAPSPGTAEPPGHGSGSTSEPSAGGKPAGQPRPGRGLTEVDEQWVRNQEDQLQEIKQRRADLDAREKTLRENKAYIESLRSKTALPEELKKGQKKAAWDIPGGLSPGESYHARMMREAKEREAGKVEGAPSPGTAEPPGHGSGSTSEPSAGGKPAGQPRPGRGLKEGATHAVAATEFGRPPRIVFWGDKVGAEAEKARLDNNPSRRATATHYVVDKAFAEKEKYLDATKPAPPLPPQLPEGMGASGGQGASPPPPSGTPGASPAPVPPSVPPSPAGSWFRQARAFIESFAQKSFPSLTRLSPKSGELLAQASNGANAAKSSWDYFSNILSVGGKRLAELTHEQRQDVGATWLERRFRTYREYLDGEFRAAQARGDTNAALEYRLARDEVVTLVGQPGSPLTSEQDYQDNLHGLWSFFEAVKQEWTPEVEKNYRMLKDLGPNDAINAHSQIPALPLNAIAVAPEDIGKPGFVGVGAKQSLGNVRLRQPGFTRQAELNAPAYDIDVGHMMQRTLNLGIPASRRAEFLRQALQDGVIVATKDGARPPEGFKPLELSPAHGLGGLDANAHYYANPEAYRDIVQGLGIGERPGQVVGSVTKPIFDKIASIALVSPVELATHVANHITALFREGMGIPIWNVKDTVKNIIDIYRKDPDILRKVKDLAAMSASFGHEARSGFLGEKLQRYDPTAYLNKFTSGFIDVMQKAVRVQLGDAFDRVAATGKFPKTETAKRDFINQALGNYNTQAGNFLTQFLKDTGLQPFATAAHTFTVQGVKSVWGGAVNAPTTSWAAESKVRTNAMLKMIPFLAIGPVMNYLRWGQAFPQNVPAFAIKMSEDDDGTVNNFDPLAFTGQRRGARATGVNAFVEGLVQGKSKGEMVEQGKRDLLHSAEHLVAGPPVQLAHTAATGENAMGHKVVKKGESETWAAVKGVNPLVATFTDADRPKKPRTIAESLMQSAGPFGEKKREKSKGLK
jgi:hypothetical protein